MAVSAVPYWLSSVHTEFGTSGNISNAMTAASLAAPRWCSALAGASNWSKLTIAYIVSGLGVGYQYGDGGSASPRAQLGSTLMGIHSMANSCEVYLSTAVASPIKITFEGYGTFTLPYIEYSSLYSGYCYGAVLGDSFTNWTFARVGQTVNFKLTF